MTIKDQHNHSNSVRRYQEKRLSPSGEANGESHHRKHELEAQCIKLEKHIIELQNSLIDSHRTRRRLEKQVDQKTDQLLRQKQAYHHQNELIDFAKHMVGRLESERNKISRELHDNVAQGLATIKLFLENKLSLMGNGENSSSFSIESILEITRDNLNDIRRIINYLRPKMLDDIGLLATIQWHWQEFQSRSPDLALSIKLAATEADVPDKLKLVVYRIIQESSKDIERHSRATRVEFELKREGQRLKLKICDDGNKFGVEDLPSELSRNQGLTIMKEYTELSDGRFSLRSSRNKGTCIDAAWDLGNR